MDTYFPNFHFDALSELLSSPEACGNFLLESSSCSISDFRRFIDHHKDLLSDRLLHNPSSISVGEKRHIEQLFSKLERLFVRFVESASARSIPSEHDYCITGRGGEVAQHDDDETPAPSPKRRRTLGVHCEKLNSAFEGRILTYCIVNEQYKDPRQFFRACTGVIEEEFRKLFREDPYSCYKYNLVLTCVYRLKVTDESVFRHFNTRNSEIYQQTDLEQDLQEQYEKILNEMQDFTENRSGEALESIEYLLLCVNKLSPFVYDKDVVGQLSGGTYIPLPLVLRRKGKCIINILSYDNFCFPRCIVASLFPARNSYYERAESYPDNFFELLNLEGIDMPFHLRNLPKFEKQNPTISVNVFTFDYRKHHINGPVYHTKDVKQHHVNLLYLCKPNSETGHFCLITDLSRACFSILSKHKSKQFICDRCLQHIPTKAKAETHKRDCGKFPAVKTILPPKGENYLQFYHLNTTLRLPFVMYADFECLTVPIHTCEPSTATSFITPYQHHVAYSVAYKIVCSFDKQYNKFETYRGDDPVGWFVRQLCIETTNVLQLMEQHKDRPMNPLTSEQTLSFENTAKCNMCGNEFSDSNRKVHHHDHYTGEYLDAICNNCNLQIKLKDEFHVFFHNFSRYDLHLLLTKLACGSFYNFNIIPLNHETFISLSMMYNNMRIVFLDSYRFLQASLEKLVSTLEPDQFRLMRDAFSEEFRENPDKFQLLLQKGIFPYDYITCMDVFRETNLPSKESFFNKLTNTHISDKDYEHAQNVWNQYNCQNLGEYSDLYLKCDVILLADIFENFRDLTMTYFGIDAAHFYTSPGISWAAALKMTKVTLELMTEPEMVLFIEKSIRGGITQAVHRHTKCNNKFVPDQYEPEEPDSYLLYVDACNLYGFALAERLPINGFEWLTQVEIDDLSRDLSLLLDRLRNRPDESVGYFFEVDLHYPASIHDEHDNFPFCPERMHTKLMCTLFDKREYVLHYRNLIQCLEHGLLVTRIHRVLKFRQEAWLKPYIDFNTELRKSAKSDFEKDFFKLLINSYFGKTLESDRKKRKIILVDSWNKARRYILRPNFKSSRVINQNLVTIELSKTEITMQRSLYIGAAVLDISKTVMYDFHYNFIRGTMRDKFISILLYMDTDSFFYKLICKSPNYSPYDMIREYAVQRFDTSNYVPDNRWGIPLVNKKVPGFFKDELGGQYLAEFVALRAKCYDYLLSSRHETDKHRRMKGIGRNPTVADDTDGTKRRKIKFSDFLDCLFNDVERHVHFPGIRSINHQLYSLNVNKLGFNANDDKRFILPDRVTTHSLGHYSIPRDNNEDVRQTDN